MSRQPAGIDSGNLGQILGRIIPGAYMQKIALPLSRSFPLYLLNEDYPQHELSAEAVQQIMDEPLYWAFCWASGLVLAELLLSEPQWVCGKRVLDFGCGSGVAAIAAALAGAKHVTACDIDRNALMATRLNAKLNGVTLELSDNFYQVEKDIDLLIVADVLYDKRNFTWLDIFLRRSRAVLLADSRVKSFYANGYRQIAVRQAHTLPDLDESVEFRDVRIYRGSIESCADVPF
ncbi:MAG: class I SAM-dependent methyltransferase [Parahaliea sp.]